MKKNIYMFLLMVVIFSFPMMIRAYSSINSYGDLKVCANNTQCENGKFSTVKGYEASILYLDIKKNIDVILPGGGVAASTFYLGQNQTAVVQIGATEGSWQVTGGWNDTPPADSKWYNLIAPRTNATNYWVQLMAEYPTDKSYPVYTSSDENIVSCTRDDNNNFYCKGINPGTAKITISFPSISIKPDAVRDINPNGDKMGYGLVEFDTQYKDNGVWTKTSQSTMFKRYKLPSITYTVNVVATTPAPTTPAVPPPTAQVTTCTGVTDINETWANLNWSYSDANSDLQTGWSVEVSSDPTFSTADYFNDHRYSNVSHNAGGTVSGMTGLKPGTTYYARINTYNNVDGWGATYANCGGFTTKAPPAPPVATCSPASGIGSNSATFNWSYYSPSSIPQQNYKIEISKNSSFSPMYSTITKYPQNVDVSSLRSYLSRGLNDQNTTYYSRISVFDGINWSANSACPVFKTLDYVGPVITSCTINNINQTEATMNWQYSDETYAQRSFTGHASNESYAQSLAGSANVTCRDQTGSTTSARKCVFKGTGINSTTGTLYPVIKGFKYINSNGTALWSEYAQCPMFRMSPLSPPTDLAVQCSSDGTKATFSWKNYDDYNNIYFRGWNLTAYPRSPFDLSQPDIDNYLIRNENIAGTSYTINIIPDNTYRWWLHTKDPNISMATGTNNIDYSAATYGLDFSCPVTGTPVTTYTLSASTNGNGTGTIGGNNSPYSSGSTAVLTAVPADGSTFTAWSGCTSTNGTQCTVSMTADRSVTATFTGSGIPPTTPPTIKITKSPAITLNKGGQCVLEWTITNKPTDMVCTLSGGSIVSKSISDTGVEVINNVQKNTKYTITCKKAGTPDVSSSVTCRVNPTAGEI